MPTLPENKKIFSVFNSKSVTPSDTLKKVRMLCYMLPQKPSS